MLQLCHPREFESTLRPNNLSKTDLPGQQNDGYSLLYPNGNTNTLQAKALQVAQVGAFSSYCFTLYLIYPFSETALVSHAGPRRAVLASSGCVPTTCPAAMSAGFHLDVI